MGVMALFRLHFFFFFFFFFFKLFVSCFSSILFEKVSVLLYSYFIHRYIIIKYRSTSTLDKMLQLLWELWSFFNFMFPSVCMRHGLRSISFEKINVLDSYFMQKYIILKYRETSQKHAYIILTPLNPTFIQ